MQKGSGGAAFTLIELLVVILILGILTAIFAPVLGRAREAGRRAQCINNLRQHGIAWYLYLDDHNEFFPGSPRRTLWWGYGASHYVPRDDGKRHLDRYLDISNGSSSPNVSLFHCPADTAPSGGFYGRGNSYYINCTIVQYELLGGPYPGRNGDMSLSAITAPHDRVCLEHDYGGNNPGHGGKGSMMPKIPVMVLFVDGHVGGPFLLDDDFELLAPYSNKKVLMNPDDMPPEEP